MQETDFFVAVLEGDFHLLHSKEEDGLDSLEEDADFIKWIILLMFSEGLRALFCFLFIILEYSLPFYKETKSDGLFTHFTSFLYVCMNYGEKNGESKQNTL